MKQQIFVARLSARMKTEGKYKNRIMQSCGCDDSMLNYVIVERTSSRFVHSVTDKMLRVASPYRSIARFAKHVPCLTESFHENVNAGGRRFAFCFRKAFDSVGDHYTSRVHISSAASFHPVNAYRRSVFSIRSARSTLTKIPFTAPFDRRV